MGNKNEKIKTRKREKQAFSLTRRLVLSAANHLPIYMITQKTREKTEVTSDRES